MVKRAVIIVLGLALVAGACGKSNSAKAATVGVQVDAKRAGLPVAFTAYFPDQVTVHAGDTVDFTEVFSGEPHTVTLGTLVSSGLDAYDKASVGKPPGSVD